VTGAGFGVGFGVGFAIASVLVEGWGLAGRDGSLGGRLGLGGSMASWLAVCLAVILTVVSLAAASLAAACSFAFASSSRFVGGRGGKLDMSQTGGSLCTTVPLDPLLVVEEFVLVKDRDDMVDSIDASDEAELRRPEGLGTVIVDGRRGGSAGDAWKDPVLEGNGGGTEASGEPAFCVLRRGKGGGASAFALTGLGGC
jgi:hypothetical protein